MRRFANIYNGVVTNVVELSDEEGVPEGYAVLSDYSPVSPGWQWTNEGGVAPIDVRARFITKRAFIMRFPASLAMPVFSKFDVLNTMLEDSTFLAAQEPNAALRMALKMLILKGRELYQQSPYVDLGGSDTVQFINALTGVPVPAAHRLSLEEAQAFLTSPVAEADRFK